MKYELPCAIVRDLLPSYVENLTETETTDAVKEHLESCADCRNRYDAMIGGEAVAVNEGKEVDYLKTLRKKNGKKVVLAVILAVLVVLVGVGIKLFWIGSPCDGSSVAINAAPSDDGTNLLLTLDEMNSSSAILGLKTETRDGITKITAREVLVSPLHKSGLASVTIPLEDVKTVEVFGRIVWQEGMVIDLHTDRLMKYKVPYVGNASAMGRLISNMDLDVPSTLELQTAHEPYGATIHFSKAIEENRRFMIERTAYILLALADNLGEVHWDDPNGYSDSLTLDEASDNLPLLIDTYNTAHSTKLPKFNSIKDYGTNCHNLQLLRNLLEI